MPPPRASISLLSKGYVCSSCLAKFQRPRYQQWLVRAASSQRINSKKTGSKKAAQPPESGARDFNKDFKEYIENEDGSLEEVDRDEKEDEKLEAAVHARLRELEAELAAVKAEISVSTSEDPVLATIQSHAENLSYHGKDLDGADHSLQDLEDVETQLDPRTTGAQVSAPSVPQPTILIDTIPLTFFPKERHPSLSRLNVSLEVAAKASTIANRKELWKWYSKCRKTLSTAWGQLPRGAWKLLWKEFSSDSLHNPDRMAHIRRLGDDMKAANIPLTPAESVLYLEAIFLDVDHKVAIEQWESSKLMLTMNDTSAIQYWALGVRMLANDDQPQLALQAADILFNSFEGDRESRVLVSVIRSWLYSGEATSVQKAWAVYIRFRQHLSSEITMEDFDSITAIFLSARQDHLALAVFRDMIISVDPVLAQRYDSVNLYLRTLKLPNSLLPFTFIEEELSWLTDDPFTVLPRTHRNKFFFGSWIKKLIGENEIDSASRVVDLMKAHGIRPDSTYLNGIIGAWLRSDTITSQGKAEDLAWKMIAARLEFVKNRARTFSGMIRSVQTSVGKKDFVRPSASAPELTSLATLETFFVLIKHYQRLGNIEKVQELFIASRAAEIKPDTNFLNGLLGLGGVEGSHISWKWNLFRQFVYHEGVVPNQTTFALMWECEKSHVNPLLGRKKANFPMPKSLFAEMFTQKTKLMAAPFPRDLFDRIILCFGLADDQVGTAVALIAMQRHFKIYPDEETVRSVVLQLAKAGTRDARGNALRRLSINSSATKTRIRNVAMILKKFKDERAQQLIEQGTNFESLTLEQAAEEALQLLCKLLRFVAESRVTGKTPQGQPHDGINTIEELGQLAAENMGVPDCIPW